MASRKKGCEPDSAPPITRSNPASAASNEVTEAKSSTTATGSGVASTCTPLDYFALDQDYFALQGQSSADPPLLSHAGAYFEDMNVLLHSPFDEVQYGFPDCDKDQKELRAELQSIYIAINDFNRIYPKGVDDTVFRAAHNGQEHNVHVARLLTVHYSNYLDYPAKRKKLDDSPSSSSSQSEDFSSPHASVDQGVDHAYSEDTVTSEGSVNEVTEQRSCRKARSPKDKVEQAKLVYWRKKNGAVLQIKTPEKL
jgi:hypothetical protein